MRDYKFSTNVYWVTSREASDLLWLQVLPPKHEAVKEFKSRVARGGGLDKEWMGNHANCIDEWLGLFQRKALDGPYAATRGDKKCAGSAYPVAMTDELTDAWLFARGERRPCSLFSSLHPHS